MADFDVIIIGAGPGGLQCAKELSDTNLNVLLIDRKPIIGPKVCAGGITGLDIDVLQIPKEELAHSFNSVTLVTNGKRLKFGIDEDYLFSIGRHDLGQWQLKQITGENIEIRTDCKAVKVTKESVELDSGEKLTYRYLVGADGATSIVRRFLGLKPGQSIATFQYVVPKIYPEMEFHLDNKLFGPGYAWIFPQKDSSLVGCGALPEHLSPQKLKKGFVEWLEKMNINVEGIPHESFPLRVEHQGWDFGNIFLIGEAAGFVSPTTGEGIYMALFSGQEIARMIINPDHSHEGMEKLVKKWIRHKKFSDIFVKAGKLRGKVISILGRVASSGYLQKKLLSRYVPEFYSPQDRQ